jgi:hypothetical protein
MVVAPKASMPSWPFRPLGRHTRPRRLRRGR